MNYSLLYARNQFNYSLFRFMDEWLEVLTDDDIRFIRDLQKEVKEANSRGDHDAIDDATLKLQSRKTQPANQ